MESVAVIVVNWNGLADTLECLESLAEQTYARVRTIVVDNGSSRDEAALIRQARPECVVAATGRNLGYTGGNNFGIAESLRGEADYIFCLNNDAIAAPDAIERLVRAMEERPDVGIAAPAVHLYWDRQEVAELGIERRFGEYPLHRHIRRVDQLSLDAAGMAETPMVSGCALMMRRTVAQRTGGFDDRYFAYLEDLDLCLRAREAGWAVGVVPEARVWHKVSRSTGGAENPIALRFYTRNAWRLVSRHGTPEEKQAFRKAYAKAWRLGPDCLLGMVEGRLGIGGPLRRSRILEGSARAGCSALYRIWLGYRRVRLATGRS